MENVAPENSVFPLSVSTSAGESVIAQGIEGGCVNFPLHKVNYDVQNRSDNDPKCKECKDSGKHTIDLSNSKLISEQENDLQLAPLFKLIFPPVELDQVLVGCGVLMRR